MHFLNSACCSVYLLLGSSFIAHRNVNVLIVNTRFVSRLFVSFVFVQASLLWCSHGCVNTLRFLFLFCSVIKLVSLALAGDFTLSLSLSPCLSSLSVNIL